MLRRKAKKQAEAQLNRDRQGSTEKPKLADFWAPNPGPQREFFDSDCHEVLYGGAAGGGKSAALTALPLKWAHLPGFLSVTLRRTFKQTRDLKAKSRELYRKVFPGLKPIKSEGYCWPFPSGAEAIYGHCQNEDDFEIYDGFEINLLCFDELTHFTKKQYKAICARVRTSRTGYPTRIRATTNPGGEGHEWVFEHWGPWLNPEFDGLEPRSDGYGNQLPPARPGEILWVTVNDDGVEAFHRERVPGSLSRTFIPAALADNPHIDDLYRAQLKQLDPVRRKQLEDGNWLIRPAAGLYFKREWLEFIDADELPPRMRWVRNWDLAATLPKKGQDPDWTAGVLIGEAVGDPYTYIADVVRKRDNPGAIETLIKATAELDGKQVPVGLPQDPGQAGKSQVSQYVKLLKGWTVLAEPENGDKGTRFGPFSTQAEHRKVRIVRGAWNAAYIAELEAFPTPGVHDDQVDATSGGYRRLASGAGRFLAAMAAAQERHMQQ